VTWTGQRLRDARARRGWTQAELAERLGAAPRSVASWEREEARPQAHWVTKLDRLFADEPLDPAQRLDQATIERALDEASFLDLLAALARKHARIAKPEDTPDLPPGRYTWYKSDAPTARRAPDSGDSKEAGPNAPADTYEWPKTTGEKNARTGGDSA
jgi:transcriptional regulator with XRE-family HTH domain